MFENVYGRTDAQTPAQLPSYKLTLWAFGSGELKTWNATFKMNNSMRRPVLSYEPHHLSSGFLTRLDTNLAVRSQKIARGLKFHILDVEGLYYLWSKNKGADQLWYYHTAALRFCFFFAYAKIKLSHDAAHMWQGVWYLHLCAATTLPLPSISLTLLVNFSLKFFYNFSW